MAPITFYIPAIAFAVGFLWTLIGPIDKKLSEKSEIQCNKIMDEARRDHKGSEWTLDDIMSAFETAWKVKEIRTSAQRDIARAIWILFGLFSSSVAGLALTVLQSIPMIPFYADFIVYIDVLISAIFVVFIPLFYRVIKQLLHKSV